MVQPGCTQCFRMQIDGSQLCIGYSAIALLEDSRVRVRCDYARRIDIVPRVYSAHVSYMPIRLHLNYLSLLPPQKIGESVWGLAS